MRILKTYTLVIFMSFVVALGSLPGTTVKTALAADTDDTEYLISTIAGEGTLGYSGDGGPATDAQMAPAGVAFDSSGNVYIAEPINNVIRKVDTNGMIIKIAGNGYSSSQGDGGPATSAGLDNPYGVAVDNNGNVFIADTYNKRVRKVDANGKIKTIAGTGIEGYSGDGGPAVSAQLNYIYGVAVDNKGNVYIADTHNHRIRKVDETGTISTIAGTGSAGFSGDGNAAISAELNTPWGVSVDNIGNVYIADTLNHRIRKVDVSGTITTIAELPETYYVTVDNSGNVFYPDYVNHLVRKLDSSGKFSIVAGTGVAGYSGDGGSARSANLNSPVGIAYDNNGNLYFSDYYNHRIRKLSVSNSNSTTQKLGGISIDASKYTLGVGDKHMTVVRSNYDDHSSGVISASNVKFVSSNPAIASIDMSGVVTGVTKGTVTISTYYTTDNNSYWRYATVTVDPKAPAFSNPSDKKAGAIYIKAVGPNGQAVEGATVKISQGSKVYPLAKTSEKGELLVYVPAGSYNVLIYTMNGTTTTNFAAKLLKVIAGQRSEPFTEQKLATGTITMNVNDVASGATAITGSAPIGSTVVARDGLTTIGTGKVDAKTGNFTVKLKQPMPGKSITVTAIDANENEASKIVTITKAVAVTLVKATKNNDVEHDIVITFKDTMGLLARTVTSVTYDGHVLTQTSGYTIVKGKLTIKAGAIQSKGDHVIAVHSSAYEDASITQTVNAGAADAALSKYTLSAPLKQGRTSTVTANVYDKYGNSAVGKQLYAEISVELDSRWEPDINKYIVDGKSYRNTNKKTVKVGTISDAHGIVTFEITIPEGYGMYHNIQLQLRTGPAGKTPNAIGSQIEFYWG